MFNGASSFNSDLSAWNVASDEAHAIAPLAWQIVSMRHRRVVNPSREVERLALGLGRGGAAPSRARVLRSHEEVVTTRHEAAAGC